MFFSRLRGLIGLFFFFIFLVSRAFVKTCSFSFVSLKSHQCTVLKENC